MKPLKESRPERVRLTRWFLHDAYTDYVAARVLLLKDLPKQACVLCSSAIEKCAKAVLAHRGNVARGHLKTTAHFNVLLTEPRYGHLLKREFLELNQKAYRLRYTDDLEVGFNMVIVSREFLVEMDHTVLTILSCFSVNEGPKQRLTGYQSAIAKGDERLVAENHLISRVPLEEFIYSKPQVVYEVRMDASRGLLEAYYSTQEKARRAGFLREGIHFADGDVERLEMTFPKLVAFELLAEGSELRGGVRPT